MSTKEELEGFFRDMTNEAGFRFRGVQFDLEHPSALRMLIADAALEVILNFLLWTILKVRTRPPGPYALFKFPYSLAADLLMESTVPRGEDRDSFDDVFFIHAADGEAVDAFLTTELKAVLFSLSQRYAIRISDRELKLGPIRGKPSESAEDFMALIEAIPM